MVCQENLRNRYILVATRKSAGWPGSRSQIFLLGKSYLEMSVHQNLAIFPKGPHTADSAVPWNLISTPFATSNCVGSWTPFLAENFLKYYVSEIGRALDKRKGTQTWLSTLCDEGPQLNEKAIN